MTLTHRSVAWVLAVPLGATWAIMKTDGDTQAWARKTARYILVYVAFFMAIVCLWVPFLDNDIGERWFGTYFYWLLPLPILTMVLFALLIRALVRNHETSPFLYSIGLFFLGYLGLGASLWPRVVPHDVTIWQAAAAPESLSLLLVGTVIMLPVVLGYTAWCYYVFRGKAGHEHLY
ncbi:MAG: cytochrome d ubiquinol oxidase subunit II, partial [Alphaproteobacteria bacterium]|nr:cytochrome d ubiquinol oxidase subunit II [Alphaproteobacteria bacterium]